MAGNVWEWVADLYKIDYYQHTNSTNPTGPPDSIGIWNRALRGGSFQDERVDVRISNRGYELGPNPFSVPQDLGYTGRTSVKIGFRCVSDN